MEDHEITANALLEAMGRALDAGTWEPPDDIVQAAVDITDERRVRRPRS